MSNKVETKVYPFIDDEGIHFQSEEWSKIPHHEEVNDMPSMVEKVYNPSIAEILANPSLMVKYKDPVYDDGEEIQPVDDEWNSDPVQQSSTPYQGASPENPDGAPAPQAPRSDAPTKEEASDKETGEPDGSEGRGGAGGE